MKTYKIGHIGDLHLGYSSGRKRDPITGINIREQDGYEAFSKIVDEMIEEKIDVLIVAGDMFHSPKPKMTTLLKAQEGCRRLAEKGIRVYIIAGNHDCTDVYEDPAANAILHEPSNGIFSYYTPYVKEEILPGIYGHFVSHHGYFQQKENLKNVLPVDNATNILVTHGAAFDSAFGEVLQTEQSPREVVISQDLMELKKSDGSPAWPLTMLGHIHERGWIGSTDKLTDTAGRNQFYSGSILRRGFSDRVSPLGRGWTMWSISEQDKFDVKMFTIPERPQYDCKPIFCKDKSADKVEKELLAQLKTIIKKESVVCPETNESVIPLKTMPLVRQTLIDMDPMLNLAIDWTIFREYTEKFFNHAFKKISRQDDTPIETQALSEDAKTNDIVTAFGAWVEQEGNPIEGVDKDIREDVKDKAEKYLKQGQDRMLEEQ